MKAMFMKVNYDPRYTKPHLASQQKSQNHVSSSSNTNSNNSHGSIARENHEKLIRKSVTEEARRRLQQQRISDDVEDALTVPERNRERPSSAQHFASLSDNKRDARDANGRMTPIRAMPVTSSGPLVPAPGTSVPQYNMTMRLRPLQSLPRKEPTGSRLLLRMPPASLPTPAVSRHKSLFPAADASARASPLPPPSVSICHPPPPPPVVSSSPRPSPPASSSVVPASSSPRHGAAAPVATVLPPAHRINPVSSFPVLASTGNSLHSLQAAQSHQKAPRDISVLLRSRTVMDNSGARSSSAFTHHVEVERRARVEAEKALKERKVFSIVGPYHSLRQSLRRRGWVEKFNEEVMQQLTNNGPARHHTAGEDTYRQPVHSYLKPWEEEGGVYGLMSRIVRNCTPTFVFTVKSGDVDPKVVKSSQLVNHFAKTAHITTKTGLSQNLRNLHWYEFGDADNFYPRCYRIDDFEEREAFREDFQVTAAISFLRHFMERYGPVDGKWGRQPMNKEDTPSAGDSVANDQLPTDARSPTREKTTSSLVQEKTDVAASLARERSNVSAREKTGDVLVKEKTDVGTEKQHDGDQGMFYTRGTTLAVPVQALDTALEICQQYCRKKDHDDIDVIADNKVLSQSQIEQFLAWFYLFVHSHGELLNSVDAHVRKCSDMLDKMSFRWPQFKIDGYQNVWILKPGAKSRGRGIQLMNKLHLIIHALESGEPCLVAQKYIERPLLVYKTKFDIRQWFLVTDWNPVTVWFYKDCYLRFCSQEYILDDFNVAIHLSNNSVQKYYQNGKRSNKLPDDNMWTCEEFAEYLGESGQSHLWTNRAIPGMKNAIVSSVLCTQESIEGRKSAFELYGADFMLDEDFNPWLLEINSSPSMAQTTRATKLLVERVLDDTLKVVLDRKADKNCDTGGFEVIYQQQTMPDNAISDTNLSVQGHKIPIRKT